MKNLLHTLHIAEICVLWNLYVKKEGVMVLGNLKTVDCEALTTHLTPLIREFVDDCQQQNYTIDEVMKKDLKFLRNWEADCEVITRDLLITLNDISNITRKLAKDTCILHSNHAQTLYMGAEKHGQGVAL